jgi:trehalose synthase-fused probable maltokinase
VFEPGGALAGMMPSSTPQRPIGADQTNTSLVVGDRLVLKLYRRLEPGPHPEIEMGRYLTDHAHITFMPAFGGSVRWGECAIAMAQAFVGDAIDGWEWGAECVTSGATESIALLGQRTRALHNALAGMQSRQATPAELRRWKVAAEAQLDQALGLVEGEVETELRTYEPRIRRELRALEAPDHLPLLTPVHGDYHIGQILKSPDGLRVVDFEGEPTRSLIERAVLGTPLRDVASMLRSFDHLARWVDREGAAGQTAASERWIRESRAAFLGAYGEFDARLLRALEVEKETYEFVYAARFLPEWMYAALGGMRWLMGGRRL